MSILPMLRLYLTLSPSESFVETSKKLRDKLWRGKHPIVLVAGTHSQTVNKHSGRVLVGWLRQRKEKNRLIPLADIELSCLAVQQQAIAGFKRFCLLIPAFY